ncbi:MAG: hypothetical protein CMP36_01140 [Rickettsiales bacterium]|nr:hypothetical protein [Rickettsiales bacterium]OUV82479.1 MAG: hypothetical protein CBC91_01560 [Rickettsiales bacterium TMED131]
MKDILLSFITLPGLIIIIYVLALTSNKRNKFKMFSVALFLFFLFSLPIFNKIISFPLVSLPKYLINDKTNNLDNASAILVLTGGVYKNILDEWQPSRSTEDRVYIAKKILTNYKLPLVISGGFTAENAPSEAQVTKKYYNLSNAILDNSSVNTYQSAISLKSYCSNLKGSLLLITDKYHTLRSFLSFRSQGCNVLIYNHSNKITFLDIIPKIQGFSRFNKAIYEYAGIMYYVLTLKINPFNVF